jgi:hypothetical protein
MVGQTDVLLYVLHIECVSFIYSSYWELYFVPWMPFLCGSFFFFFSRVLEMFDLSPMKSRVKQTKMNEYRIAWPMSHTILHWNYTWSICMVGQTDRYDLHAHIQQKLVGWAGIILLYEKHLASQWVQHFCEDNVIVCHFCSSGNVTPFGFVNAYLCFIGMYHLHLQGELLFYTYVWSFHWIWLEVMGQKLLFALIMWCNIDVHFLWFIHKK